MRNSLFALALIVSFGSYSQSQKETGIASTDKTKSQKASDRLAAMMSDGDELSDVFSTYHDIANAKNKEGDYYGAITNYTKAIEGIEIDAQGKAVIKNHFFIIL